MGPLVLTAVVSAIGNGAAFKKGREFAAWLGLVPRQWSTGGKPKLLGIRSGETRICARCSSTERGLRVTAQREGSRLGKWMSGLETRTARNVVIVATANKLARISWAVLSSGNDYQPLHKAADAFQLDEVEFEILFQESAEDRNDENTVKRRA